MATEGVLTLFLDEARPTMNETNRKISEPAQRTAGRARRDSGSQKRQERSLAGTALTRRARATIEQAGLKAEALTLEKAPTAREAGEIAQKLNATAELHLENARPRWEGEARAAIETAALTGAALESVLDNGGQDDTGDAMGQLARHCASLLKMLCQAAEKDNYPTGWHHGEEAKHAVETAINGTGPEGVPGSRGKLKK